VSGNVIGAMDNLPFGEDALTGSGQDEKHRFTSYERDSETATDYAVNRQYQMSVGRFNRPDPVGGSIGNPQSLNRYAYVQSDPINAVDPLGLFLIGPLEVLHEFHGIIWHSFYVGPGTGGGEEDSGRLGEGRVGGGGGQRSEISADRRFYKEPTKPKPSSVLDCYNKWKFSSTIAGLAGEEYRGFAEALEIASPLSLGSDILAMITKAQRKGVGGPENPYASGLNALFRAIGKTLGLPSVLRELLTSIGDKATPLLRIVGAAVIGYNAGIYIQCVFGLLK
jgi:RHS repeat-associated protein